MYLPRLFGFYSILQLCRCDIVSQFSQSNRLTGTSFGIPGIDASYDYVIVGGGLAGSVVASRLTEHSNASVALIEAGSFYELSNGNWSQIPFCKNDSTEVRMLEFNMLADCLEWTSGNLDDWQPLIDWGLETEPQVVRPRKCSC